MESSGTSTHSRLVRGKEKPLRRSPRGLRAIGSALVYALLGTVPGRYFGADESLRARPLESTLARGMLTYGEIFVVAFITFAILSSTYWLKIGGWLGVRWHRFKHKPRPRG